MSKLIIFAPKCGGNHLANLIGASHNLSNCLNLQELAIAYQKDENPINTHMNKFFLKELVSDIDSNSIYVGHLNEVFYDYNKLKDKIKDVLVIELFNTAQNTIRGRKITYLESCVYTKEFIEKLFPIWDIKAIHLEDLFSKGDMLKFLLESTNFNISDKCVKLHNMWLKKIEDRT